MTEAVPREIVDELKAIRNDLDYIKENMVDIDMFLTKEEEKRVDGSLKEYKEGKATKLEDFEKEIS